MRAILCKNGQECPFCLEGEGGGGPGGRALPVGLDVGAKAVEEIVAAFAGPFDLVGAQVAHDAEHEVVERGFVTEN